jgi:hypothetical protein
MENEFKTVTLSDIANGGLEELFQAAQQQLLANIHNPNTPAEAKRSIDIKLLYVTDEERREIRVAIAVTPKLASVRGTGTTLYTSDRPKQGKFLALETNLKQMRLDEAETQRAETGLPLRPASVDTPPAQ